MKKGIVDDDGTRRVDLQQIFGRGYNNGLFFVKNGFKGRYRFFVGSRQSKKSQDILGYEPIIKIMSDPVRNIVMLRQNDVDNRTSTFPNLMKCIKDFGFESEFKTTSMPLEITYKPTGQKIIFKGMNNPTSITSTKFAVGELTDIYIEEAFQVDDYDAFMQLDGSLRVGADLYDKVNIQITCVMNPWSPDHWIYQKFFKGRLEPTDEYMETHMFKDYRDDNYVGPFGIGLYLHQSNYKINEFRAPTYDLSAQEMKRVSPDLYRTNFLGLFGAITGPCYAEFKEHCIGKAEDLYNRDDIIAFAIGIDTGLSNGEGKKVKIGKNEDPEKKIRSATTMTLVGITKGYEKIIVFEEYFHSNIKEANETNTDDRNQLLHMQLLERMLDTISQWAVKYKNVPKGNVLMKGVVNCFIDNADIATRDDMIILARKHGMFNVNFIPSTKKTIQTRVDFTKLLMGMGDFIVSENCKNLIREYRNARKGDSGEARAPGNDHTIDSVDYAAAPFYSSITNWKMFKEH